MNVIQPSTDYVASVSLVDENGADLSPSAVTVTVMDENDNVLINNAAADSFDTNSATFTVDKAYNGLTTEVRGGRLIKWTAVTSSGSKEFIEIYLVKKSQTITLYKNSFMTLTGANMLADSMTDVSGFFSALDDVEKMNALEEAFTRITSLSYLDKNYDSASQSIITWWDDDPSGGALITRNYFLVLDEDKWNALSEDFRVALKKAQIAEASEILSDDPLARRRTSGLLSETIGESSMMFKTMRPLYSGLSKRSMSYLGKYLNVDVSIARA